MYYEPLPPVADSSRAKYTRILHLEPGQGEDEPFRGRLEIIDLKAAPPYEALSYTWGKDPPNNYIWINNEPLPIQPNLEGALHAVRLGSAVRHLWIDALCIDQSSPEERSRQVSYMRSVYQYSSNVIVWLGPKVDGVDTAFEAARRIFDKVRFAQEGAGSNSVNFNANVTHDLVTNALEGLPSTAMQDLRTLLSRDYFSRCWVVQEVTVGTRPLVKCGDLEMPFFQLLSSFNILGFFQDIIQVNTLSLWHLIFTKRNASSSLMVPLADIDGSLGPLIDLLESLRSFQATDQRDRIYSLLGICDEGIQPSLTLTQITPQSSRRISLLNRAMSHVQKHITSRNPDSSLAISSALRPDYTKDLVSVYIDIMRYFISKMPKLLDVLSHVQHHKDPSEVPDDAFPSWVVKWHEPSTYAVFRGHTFTAGVCIPPASDIFQQQSRIHRALADPRRLVMDGFQMGVVRQVTDVARFSRDPMERKALIHAIWSQLFPFPMGSGQMYCRGGERLEVAFCRAIFTSPYGALLGSLLTDATLGFKASDQQWKRETLEAVAERSIESFLQDRQSRDWSIFLNGVCQFSHNRRIFITTTGHIGIGPVFMRPGDEVVVLFKGRMPYILRRQPDHHIFIGDAYVRDDEIMFGKVTENVRHGRGGPPVSLYEIR